MRSSLERTRLDLCRAQQDLAKKCAHADEDRARQDKALNEKMAKIRKLETELSDAHENLVSVQSELRKTSSANQAQQGEISVQSHECSMLQRRYEDERAQAAALRKELDDTKASLALESRAAKSASGKFEQISEVRLQNTSLLEQLASAEHRVAIMVSRVEYEKIKNEARESKELSLSLHDCVSVLDGEVEVCEYGY